MWWLLQILLLPVTSHGRMDCSKREYEKCIKIADPLIKEAHLVFPDNINDIDQVCNIWNQFVDCLKVYTDDCFTAQQRSQFNQAVESPIESVHQMCMQPSYQKEYLQYATCIKNTIVQNIHCGPQYRLLVDLVEQGDIISKSTLCCSHDRFKQCVQRETRRLCDRGITDGPAYKFATQIIDKALRFLQDQCLNYIPNSGDCPVHPTVGMPFAERSDPLAVSTLASDSSSRSTINEEVQQKDVALVRSNLPKATTTFSWSSSNNPTGESPMLGSRTRPASYGRASSWADSSPGIAGNTVQMYPELSSTESTNPSWASASWRNRAPSSTMGPTRSTERFYSPQWSSPSVSTEIWYPAAGSQSGNEVDEPNQLGWRKPQNSSPNSIKIHISIAFIGLLLILV